MYGLLVSLGPSFQLVSLCCEQFRVNSYFVTSVPNNLKVTLNIVGSAILPISSASTRWVPTVNPFRCTAHRFRVTWHFETGALIYLQNYFGHYGVKGTPYIFYQYPQVPNIEWFSLYNHQRFWSCIPFWDVPFWGIEWSQVTLDNTKSKVTHTYSAGTNSQNFQSVLLYGQPFSLGMPFLRHVNDPKWPWTIWDQRYPIYDLVVSCSPSRSKVSHFRVTSVILRQVYQMHPNQT